MPAEIRHAVGMVQISAPRYSDDSADKGLECEFALEPIFREVVRLAEAEGWSQDEVAAALTALAHHHLMGIIEDRKIRLSSSA